MEAMESIICPVCGFIAETTDQSRLRTVWADHLLGGCGDESKTTGTQLQISPEVKAEMNDMGAAQKEARAERKQERAEARNKRR